MPTSGCNRPSARCCWARRGSAHPPTSSVAGGSRWSTSTTGRGPWQSDLEGPAADSSLPVVVVPRSASGSRATEHLDERPKGIGPERTRDPKGHPLSDHDRSRDWPAFAGLDWGGSEHQLCILDAQGARLAQQRVTHDVAGLTELDT